MTTQLATEAFVGDATGALTAADIGADPAGTATAAVSSEATARDAAIAAAIAALIASAPGLLDTLDEIAAALGDDPNFATTITTALATKVAKSLYDANTILKADSDDTPAALTVAEQTIVGRKTGGNITALTASEVRTLLALVVGTNVQAWDGGLTTIAAIDSTTAGALVTDGSGWIRKTYAQLKTALGLTKADVGLGNVDNTADSAKTFTESQITNLPADLAALQTQLALQAAKLEARRIADQYNRFVCTGMQLSPAVSTSTKLDMSLGTVFKLFNETPVSAQAAINKTIATLASDAGLTAGQAVWVIVEFETPTTVAFNAGTASSAPAFPTMTTTRVPLGFLYIPYGATVVDAILDGTPNGNAKLIDARVVRPGPLPSGWIHDQNTWTYASATTFTVAGVDATSYLTPGTKISYNDGAVDYGVVASSSFSTDTTVTLITNSDYTIANATLVRPRYSQAATPQGFPGWFNWSPTVVGWSASPPTAVYQWKPMSDNSILITIRHSNTQASTGATHTITLPVTAATVSGDGWGVICRATDNGTVQFGAVQVLSAGTVASLLGNGFSGTNAGTGQSNIFFAQLIYQF